MDFQSYFPIWKKLTPMQQERILNSLTERKVSKGTVIHNGNMDCTGLLLVKSGQLRAYILSDEGREITIYRLFERDMCLFSASCIMRSIQFEVTVEAEKDTDLWVIPSEIYQSIMEGSAPVSNYTNETDGLSLLRCHVAHGAGHVEEPGQTGGGLSAGGGLHRGEQRAEDHHEPLPITWAPTGR